MGKHICRYWRSLKIIYVAVKREEKNFLLLKVIIVVGSVGNTPLIKLERASEMTECNIMVKAEMMNPGGSVKDRAALYLIKDAEEKGLIQPGGTIVEGMLICHIFIN